MKLKRLIKYVLVLVLVSCPSWANPAQDSDDTQAGFELLKPKPGKPRPKPKVPPPKVPVLPRPKGKPLFPIGLPAVDAIFTRLNNIFKKGMKDGDITGTICDVHGKPIPKVGKPGFFWDHLTEMVNNCRGIGSAIRELIVEKARLVKYKQELIAAGYKSSDPTIVGIQGKISQIEIAITAGKQAQQTMLQCFKGEMPDPLPPLIPE